MHLAPLFRKFWFPILGLSFFTGSSLAENLSAPLPPSQTSESATDDLALESTLPVVAMGNPKAPLKIVMFHSLNCSHCKDFKVNVLPKIQTQFIDQDLIYFQFIDFPTDRSSLDAAKIAWGARDMEIYKKASHLLTENYERWAGQPDWQKELCQIVIEKQLMTEKECIKSLADEALGEEILRISFEAQKKHKIDYAPAFLFNGKLKQTTEPLSFDDIKAELKTILDNQPKAD